MHLLSSSNARLSSPLSPFQRRSLQHHALLRLHSPPVPKRSPPPPPLHPLPVRVSFEPDYHPPLGGDLSGVHPFFSAHAEARLPLPPPLPDSPDNVDPYVDDIDLDQNRIYSEGQMPYVLAHRGEHIVDHPPSRPPSPPSWPSSPQVRSDIDSYDFSGVSVPAPIPSHLADRFTRRLLKHGFSTFIDPSLQGSCPKDIMYTPPSHMRLGHFHLIQGMVDAGILEPPTAPLRKCILNKYFLITKSTGVLRLIFSGTRVNRCIRKPPPFNMHNEPSIVSGITHFHHTHASEIDPLLPIISLE